MSRSGDRRELLRGPLVYGIIFILSTLFYWRQLTGVRCASTRILPSPQTSRVTSVCTDTGPRGPVCR